MGPHEIANFYNDKDTAKRTKWQPTYWKRIFTNPISNRGLISNIYKELKKLDSTEWVVGSGSIFMEARGLGSGDER